MNRGNIPGYYFDEDKKKYFKIQANHIAPENAKYSKTNAKLELRENKKRKREEKHNQVLRRQTVVKAKPLQHTLLAGAGLHREIGTRPYTSQHAQRDVAFVQGLEATETEIELQGFTAQETVLTDAHNAADQSRLVLAVRHSVASHALYSFRHQGEWTSKKTCKHGGPISAFHEPIAGSQYTPTPTMGIVMAHTARANSFSGDTAVTLVMESDPRLDPMEDRTGDELQTSLLAMDGVYSICPSSETLWDCRLNAADRVLAAGGTFGATILDLRFSPNTIGHLNAEQSGTVMALDWLDKNTFALGLKPYLAQDSAHGVVLWDIRARGLAQRIQRRDKILGVQMLDDSPEARCGHNLLVASSHDINLYDLRNLSKDRPVLSLEHKSGTPHVHLSTLNENLLAATDWTNKVQVYSLRTGTHLRTLTPYRGRKGLISKPRWQEDHRGVPYLQACVGHTIQRWS